MGKKPSVKESAIERELVARVRDLGGICVKVTVIGQRGFFDRLIILPGLPGPRIIFCEIKKPRGSRISPHQQRYHARYDALGVEVAIVRTPEDIAALLKK